LSEAHADERAVDAEVLIGQQSDAARSLDDGAREFLGDVVDEQPVAIACGLRKLQEQPSEIIAARS
jgi:hypothetical protein